MLDIGGTLAGYLSDTTRTVWVSGEAAIAPAPEFVRVYELVRDAQAQATAAVRPGVPAERIDAIARSVIVAGGYGESFTHRVGHGIGLEVHEDPYMVAGNSTPLAPGMAFSVEPGIYLPGRWGVRLENIVICVPDGATVLNQSSLDLREFAARSIPAGRRAIPHLADYSMPASHATIRASFRPDCNSAAYGQGGSHGLHAAWVRAAGEPGRRPGRLRGLRQFSATWPGLHSAGPSAPPSARSSAAGTQGPVAVATAGRTAAPEATGARATADPVTLDNITVDYTYKNALITPIAHLYGTYLDDFVIVTIKNDNTKAVKVVVTSEIPGFTSKATNTVTVAAKKTEDVAPEPAADYGSDRRARLRAAGRPAPQS